MKPIFAAILAVVVLLQAFAPAAAQDGDIDKDQKIKLYVDAARKALEKRAVGAARQYLQKAHQLDKNNFDVHYYMGLSFYIDENRGGMMKWMLGALKINPKHQQANYYVGRSELELEHLDKAVKYLKAARSATVGRFPDPQMQIMVDFSYGVAMVKTGKAKDGVKVLRELAEGGKFESFATRKDLLRKIYYEGYQFTGEAYTQLGQFSEADKFLSKMATNHKQMNEGKWGSEELLSAYVMNKHRVVIPSQGQVQGDLFLNPSKQLKIKKPKGWDFVFHHPECYQHYKDPEGWYKQNSQAACAAVWLIQKNKERVYKKVVDFTVEAWDLNVSLTMGGESVALSSPKDVARTRLAGRKERWEPVLNRKLRPPMPTLQKTKFNRQYSAAWFKGTFALKEAKNVKQDYEFWCFKGRAFSYFIEITGDHGMFKEYGREIEMLKRSIQLVK